MFCLSQRRRHAWKGRGWLDGWTWMAGRQVAGRQAGRQAGWQGCAVGREEICGGGGRLRAHQPSARAASGTFSVVVRSVRARDRV